MSQIRAVLRSTALRTEDPAELLTRLDEHVQYFLPDTMATALCGILSPAANALHTSSAGHLPPNLAAPHDVATILTIPVDLPLGVKSGRPRHSIHVPLPRSFCSALVLHRRACRAAEHPPPPWTGTSSPRATSTPTGTPSSATSTAIVEHPAVGAPVVFLQDTVPFRRRIRVDERAAGPAGRLRRPHQRRLRIPAGLRVEQRAQGRPE